MDRIRLRKPMSKACVSFGKPLARFRCLPENIGHLWTGHIREFKHRPLCLSLTLKNCLSKFQPSAAPHHPGEANHQTWQGACQVTKAIVRTSAFLDLLHKGDGRFWVSQTKGLDTPLAATIILQQEAPQLPGNLSWFAGFRWSIWWANATTVRMQ